MMIGFVSRYIKHMLETVVINKTVTTHAHTEKRSSCIDFNLFLLIEVHALWTKYVLKCVDIVDIIALWKTNIIIN